MTLAGPPPAAATRPAHDGDAGRICPYCRFPLKSGGMAAVCAGCGAVHHGDCWTDNGGCAVVACGQGPPLRPAMTDADPPSRPTLPQPRRPPPAPPVPPVGLVADRRLSHAGGRALTLVIGALAVAVLGVLVVLLTRNHPAAPGSGAPATKTTPTPVPGGAVTSRAFHTPGDNVDCQITSVAATCTVASIGTTFAFANGGQAEQETAAVVRRGVGLEAAWESTVAVGAVRCFIPAESTPEGITCTDTRSGNGFEASRIPARQRLFSGSGITPGTSDGRPSAPTMKTFHVPSGNVACEIMPTSAVCSVASIGTTFAFTNDGPARQEASSALPRGAGLEVGSNSTVAVGAAECVVPLESQRRGVTCTDATSGTGFEASAIPTRQRLF